jgi:hypothetical protein
MSKELLQNQILKCQNGSKLYGTDTPTSDDDYMAIFVEPPEYLFSLRQAKTVALHDRGPNERNFDADVDGIAYPLRHFLKLAMDGNPSILTLLFAQPEHVVDATALGQLLLDNKQLFISAKAGPKFLGYMNGQLQRLKGEKKGHIPARPEIVEQFGYDTKYAMQVARLAIQGLEYLTEGKITLPVDSANRELLLGIRNGEHTFEGVIAYLGTLEESLKLIVDGRLSPLKEEPDYEGIYKLSQYIHEEFWNGN